jgi:hypothetical protein
VSVTSEDVLAWSWSLSEAEDEARSGKESGEENLHVRLAKDAERSADAAMRIQ